MISSYNIIFNYLTVVHGEYELRQEEVEYDGR